MEKNEKVGFIDIADLVDRIIRNGIDPEWNENNGMMHCKTIFTLNGISDRYVADSVDEFLDPEGDSQVSSVLKWKNTLLAMIKERYLCGGDLTAMVDAIKEGITLLLKQDQTIILEGGSRDKLVIRSVNSDFQIAINELEDQLKREILFNVEKITVG